MNRNANAGPRREVIGVDTETRDGNIFLIADSKGNFLDNENITFENVAKFLLDHEGKWLFFYNLLHRRQP